MRSRRRSRSRPLSRETTAASRSTGRVSGGCGALSRGTAGRGGSGSWGQPCRSTCPRTPLPRPKTSSACSAGRLRNVGRGAADASRGAPTGFFIGRVAKGLRSGSRPSQGPALTGTGPHRDRPSQRPALTRTGCAPATSPGRWDQLGSACHLSAACRPRSVPPGRCGRGRSGAPA